MQKTTLDAFAESTIISKELENTLPKQIQVDAFLVYTSNHGRCLGEHGWFGSGGSMKNPCQIPLIHKYRFIQN